MTLIFSYPIIYEYIYKGRYLMVSPFPFIRVERYYIKRNTRDETKNDNETPEKVIHV